MNELRDAAAHRVAAHRAAGITQLLDASAPADQPAAPVSPDRVLHLHRLTFRPGMPDLEDQFRRRGYGRLGPRMIVSPSDPSIVVSSLDPGGHPGRQPVGAPAAPSTASCRRVLDASPAPPKSLVLAVHDGIPNPGASRVIHNPELSTGQRHDLGVSRDNGSGPAPLGGWGLLIGGRRFSGPVQNIAANDATFRRARNEMPGCGGRERG
jgi:hypothetical protein